MGISTWEILNRYDRSGEIQTEEEGIRLQSSQARQWLEPLVQREPCKQTQAVESKKEPQSKEPSLAPFVFGKACALGGIR